MCHIPEKRVIRRADGEEHVWVWPEGAKPSRFAPYRIRRGIAYAGVSATLSKPHGLRGVMEEALRATAQKGLRRWDSVFGRMVKVSTELQAAEAISLLISAGVLAVRERNKRPAKGEHWYPLEIEVDGRARSEVGLLYSKPAADSAPFASLVAETQAIRERWQLCPSELAGRVEALVDAAIRRLDSPDSETGFPFHPRWAIQYRSLLLTLAHARLLMGTGETMPLRTLSTNLWNNSKILDRYQARLARLIQAPLSVVGITTHPDVTWAYGNVLAQMEGQTFSLLHGRPAILAEDTVRLSRFQPGYELKSILLVENLTAFLTLLNRTYYGRKDVFVVWSAGYWNSLHRQILRDLLRQRSLRVHVWADLDGDGLNIANQICRWVESQGGVASPLLMGEQEWKRGVSGRIATDRDRELAANPSIIDRFGVVARLIGQEGKTVEQETLLQWYDHVSPFLP